VLLRGDKVTRELLAVLCFKEAISVVFANHGWSPIVLQFRCKETNGPAMFTGPSFVFPSVWSG
jgi:hypothetical protein